MIISMKKILFTFLFLLTSSVVFADGGANSIEVVHYPFPGHNRDGIALPVVTYSPNENTFTIEFESEDSYELKVKDVYGTTWYSGPLNTSGIPTVYYVNLQSHNTYLISISSSNDLFYGILEM